MRNIILRSPRRCGLCYFHLKTDTPFLETPTVSRKIRPIWPVLGWNVGLLDDAILPPEPVNLITLKTELNAIHVSSQRGCVGCAAILPCLEYQVQEKGLSFDQNCLGEQCELEWLVGDSPAHRGSLHVNLTVNAGGGRYIKKAFAITIGYTRRTNRQSFLSLLETLTANSSVISSIGHPAALQVSRAVAQGYTGSLASLHHLKTWLKECESSHKACKQPASSLPYRILELSKDSNNNITVCLIQNSKREEPYACLSHRWGVSTHRCQTTNNTLCSHLKSVPWANLPKTFQETASLVLHLGLKYLWIDSLCIIQDDKNDWRTQAGQMCNIYHGSYITIAATSSTDSDDGLFRTMPRFPIQAYSSSYQELFICKAPEHSYGPSAGSDNDESDEFALLKRGWVYQERLLSLRLVHFSRYELRFECASATAPCECGMDEPWFRKRYYNQILASSDLAEIRGHWHTIVSEFSSLQLTYPSDSLSALAGVARRYGMAHKDVLGRYVAGLWEYTLAHDLLWHLTESTYEIKRSDAPCVPTWSWASTTLKSGTLRYNRTTYDLEVVSVNIDLAGPDEYGPVNSAELTLRGYLAVGTWKWAASRGDTSFIHFCIDSNAIAAYMNIDYDFSIQRCSAYVPEGSPIYCLKTGFVGDGCHVCLILRAVDEKQRIFERIGLLKEAQKEEVDTWFNGGQARETFKLI